MCVDGTQYDAQEGAVLRGSGDIRDDCGFGFVRNEMKPPLTRTGIR